jgi:hypothetical protein
MVARQPPSEITMCTTPAGGVDLLDVWMIDRELEQ